MKYPADRLLPRSRHQAMKALLAANPEPPSTWLERLVAAILAIWRAVA